MNKVRKTVNNKFYYVEFSKERDITFSLGILKLVILNIFIRSAVTCF